MPWEKKGASCFAMYGFAVSVHPNGTQTRTSNQYEPRDDLHGFIHAVLRRYLLPSPSPEHIRHGFTMLTMYHSGSVPPLRRLLPRVHLPSARLIFPTALKKGEYWQGRGQARHLSHEHSTKKFGGNAETIGFRIFCARSNPGPTTAGRSIGSGYFALHS